MEEKEIKQKCLNLMETADAIYLSTNGGDGYPHTRMMSNLRNKEENPGAAEVIAKKEKDDFKIYFVTSKSSPKMQHIRANTKVSAYFCNPKEIQTLMLAGEVGQVNDLEFKRKIWQDEWKIHWPKGPEDPELTVIKLLPSFARGLFKEGPFEFKI